MKKGLRRSAAVSCRVNGVRPDPILDEERIATHIRHRIDAAIAPRVRTSSLMKKGLRRAPVAPVKSHKSLDRSENRSDKWRYSGGTRIGYYSHGRGSNSGRGFREEKSGRVIRAESGGFH
jgi:hypothetical protein